MPELTIIFRHILPNTFHILLVQATIVFVAAIKSEVILSFLGLGVKDGVSWGLMIAESPPGGAGRSLQQFHLGVGVPVRAGDGLQHVLRRAAGRARSEEGVHESVDNAGC